MEQHWTPYVPYHVVEDLLENPDDDPVSGEQRFTAVVMFADISGFTAMSEALGQSGPAGTEELTMLLNSYFAPMIDLIQGYGGIIGKFSGDALTVLFRFTPTLHIATIRRAVACALQMQAQMSHYAALPTSAGTFCLAIKIGLAEGAVVCCTTGDPALRLEYLIMGSVLSRAARAQQCAHRGEVVLHCALLEPAAAIHHTPPVIHTTPDAWHDEQRDYAEHAPCFARVLHLDGVVEISPLPPPPQHLPVAVRGVLEAFHHPAIALRLSKNQRDLINEHRKVTALFVQFPDFDYDHDAAVCTHLHAYFDEVLWVIGRYDGYLRQVDMGDKGSKYIVLFGAPLSHENDEERALRCALELRNVAHMPTRIGIATGFVYCGLIGSQRRREYAVVGDTMNLAARLMQAAAPGQILVCRATREGVSSRAFQHDPFVWQPLEPLHVKGKAEPVHLAALRGLHQHHPSRLALLTDGLPMVGRTAEMEHAETLLTRVLVGRGHIIGITAEPGMGKSRLAAEIARRAEGHGLACFTGTCLSYATTSGYLVWQELLQGLFELATSSEPASQVQQLEQQLATLGTEYVQRLPLLGSIFNLAIPDSELTRGLDSRLRKESLEALLTACIRQHALHTPLLLLLEDCHWIDSLSHDLLEIVARSIIDRPVLIIVVYRPPEVEPVRLRVRHLAHFSEMRLGELSHEESARLITLKLAQHYHISAEEQQAWLEQYHLPALIERIGERAQGNPLYIDAIINLLHERDLHLHDTALLDTLELPDTLHNLIISRIDQLREGPKTTLKVASVIGQRFHAAWLPRVYPPLGTADLVIEHMEYLCRLELTVLEPPPPELAYLFKHILTREVAYASLSLATREMLHEQIGSLIEGHYHESLDSWLDVLAYHYGESQNTEKQRCYFRRAGAAARTAHANDTAICYYQRLLPLLPTAEQIGLLLEMGDICQLVGRWDEAEAHYLQAQVLAIDEQDHAAQARCQYAQGNMFYLKGLYAEALVCMEEVLHDFAALEDQAGVMQTLRVLGDIYLQQASYPHALAYYEQCQRVATTLGDQREASRAIANMGHIYFYQGDYPRTLDCYEQWLYMAIELGDQQQAGYMLGRLGHVYSRLGNTQGALFCYEQQLRIATEIGDLRMVSVACTYMAEVYGYYLGDLERSLACLFRRLEIGVALEDHLGILIGIGYIAVIYAQQHHYALSEWFFEHALKLGRALNIPYHLCEFLAAQAQMCWHTGHYAEALAANSEALTLASEMGRHDIQLQAQILELRLGIVLHTTTTAQAIATLEQMLHEWSDSLDQALLHDTIWRMDRSREAHRKAALALYQQHNLQSLRLEHRIRYQELGGDVPPTPTEHVPDLPDAVTRSAVNLALLLYQVDQIIEQV